MRLDAADAALAGLALVEAACDNNPTNRNNLLDTTDTADLVIGLLVLASSLRSSLAAASGIDVAEVDENFRAMYLHHSEHLHFGGAV